jgi:hypothetical protein
MLGMVMPPNNNLHMLEVKPTGSFIAPLLMIGSFA